MVLRYMSNSSAAKRLAKGTVVYMIGNMMSKVLQMLILPIITASLKTSEYGYYDLIVTTINLVTPVITFQMIEGMFRFMYDGTEDDKKSTVSTVTAFLVGGGVALAIIIFTGSLISDSLQYPVLIYLNYISSIIFTYMQKLARCQQKNQQFAISGVLNTIVMLATQALTLLVLNMGIDGMLIANFISYIIAALYLMFFLDIKHWLGIRYINKTVFFKLIRYSAPLIPNSICWWLVSSSDRYVITYFLGTAANGIYSIAGKFSQMITFATSVFQLAWQESAIMEENSENRDKFYSDTFNTYMKLLLGGYLVILPFIKMIMPVLVSKEYQIGYLYNPILLIGAILSAFSQFYGSAYLVFKKTSGALSTTVVAAIINILIGIGLTPVLGLYAPALGTAIAFGVQWVMRMYQMRTYFKVSIELKNLFILLGCVVIETVGYYFNRNELQILLFIFGCGVCLKINWNLVSGIVKKMKGVGRK